MDMVLSTLAHANKGSSPLWGRRTSRSGWPWWSVLQISREFYTGCTRVGSLGQCTGLEEGRAGPQGQHRETGDCSPHFVAMGLPWGHVWLTRYYIWEPLFLPFLYCYGVPLFIPVRMAITAGDLSSSSSCLMAVVVEVETGEEIPQMEKEHKVICLWVLSEIRIYPAWLGWPTLRQLIPGPSCLVSWWSHIYIAWFHPILFVTSKSLGPA